MKTTSPAFKSRRKVKQLCKMELSTMVNGTLKLIKGMVVVIKYGPMAAFTMVTGSLIKLTVVDG